MKSLRAVLVVALLAVAVLVLPGQPAGAQTIGYGLGQSFEDADDCFIQSPLAGLTGDQETDSASITRYSFFFVQLAQLECTFFLDADDVTPPGGFATGFDCLVPVEGDIGSWNTNLSTFSIAPRESGGYRGSLRCVAVIPFSAVDEVSVASGEAGA